VRAIFLLIPIFLFARINPFEPVISPENTLVVKPKYFKKVKVYLPENARILKKIIFVYQTLSGDIKQKEVGINKNIDFHKPIILMHKIEKFPERVLKFSLFKMYIKNKKMFIEDKDKLLRQFFLVKPFRIILDFKRKSDFSTIKKIIKNSFVKKVIIGSHGNFYRVVIYFDAKYNYKIKKDVNGVLIELK